MRYQEPDYLPWDGRRVPMTFIGGYLGAGKTTAINELLRHAEQPIAVIVNDVGSMNIDAKLIRKRAGDMIEVTGGCVCCSSLDGMGAALDQIRARRVPPDQVVVELSGVADPQRMLPWAQSAGFSLDSVVIVAAADQLLDESMPPWVHEQLLLQISQADLLILTKLDLVTQEDISAARLVLSELAPGVSVFETVTDEGLALGRFLALGAREKRSEHSRNLTSQSTLFDAHRVESVSAPANYSATELRTWLDATLRRTETVASTVVRAKGILHTSDLGLVVVQVVGKRIELNKLPAAEPQKATDLIVITLKSQ
jgi:G3E family GTPase